jgi:TolA-binding protein
MSKALLLLTLACGVAFAQTAPMPYFPDDLRQYLNLSTDQVASIGQINGDYQQYSRDKQQRIAQLQSEIADLTRQDVPDPMAIGQRYVEMETIRRDLQAQASQITSKVRAVLNPDQLTKLKTLEDAQKLQSLICSAQYQNLLSPAPASFAGFLLGLPAPVQLGPPASAVSPACSPNYFYTGRFLPQSRYPKNQNSAP